MFCFFIKNRFKRKGLTYFFRIFDRDMDVKFVFLLLFFQLKHTSQKMNIPSSNNSRIWIFLKRETKLPPHVSLHTNLRQPMCGLQSVQWWCGSGVVHLPPPGQQAETWPGRQQQTGRGRRQTVWQPPPPSSSGCVDCQETAPLWLLLEGTGQGDGEEFTPDQHQHAVSSSRQGCVLIITLCVMVKCLVKVFSL